VSPMSMIYGFALIRLVFGCVSIDVFLDFEIFLFKINFFMILDHFDVLMPKIIFLKIIFLF